MEGQELTLRLHFEGLPVSARPLGHHFGQPAARAAMNLASQCIKAGASQLLFGNFNPDNTGPPVDSKIHVFFFFFLVSADTEDVCIVERLFSSSLVAIVSLKAPRKLKVCHFKKGTEICNYSYSNTILAVKLNRQRLIVCLEESLYIHNILLHTIRETPPNPAGLCALSINSDNCYLAYPGSATIGEVQVFDTINLRAANMIPAHDSPLAALAFDASGTKLATASEKVGAVAQEEVGRRPQFQLCARRQVLVMLPCREAMRPRW
ncbi:WD repeat domain phosphoinositide-interacting protein 2-like [Cavia porcellus]|uniref:WD repeat domain phosphoinositide-interacting protein 2-like n=1 Tax=Cavia porcellus TaxID=10141 RepID=UPI002FE2CBE7